MYNRLLQTMILLCALRNSAGAADKQLSVQAAQNVAEAALSAETRRLPGLSLNPGKIEDGRCLEFDVRWANRGPGSVHVEFLTIDLRTAAVWTGVAGSLSLVSNPALARHQHEARRSVGATDAEYKAAVESHPCGY